MVRTHAHVPNFGVPGLRGNGDLQQLPRPADVPQALFHQRPRHHYGKGERVSGQGEPEICRPTAGPK